MKKTVIAGVASFAFAATPVFGVFATNPTVTDTLTVTVAGVCTFARTGGSATYEKTMTAGQLDTSFGSSTFTANCNNGSGYSISATFSSLTFSGATSPIAYSATTPTEGSGTWTAAKVVNTTETNLAASGAVLGSRNTQDPAGGSTYTVKYKVGLFDNQPKGTYTGTATYALTQAS